MGEALASAQRFINGISFFTITAPLLVFSLSTALTVAVNLSLANYSSHVFVLLLTLKISNQVVDWLLLFQFLLPGSSVY